MKLGEAIYKSENENPDTNNENPDTTDNDKDVFDADYEDLTDNKK